MHYFAICNALTIVGVLYGRTSSAAVGSCFPFRTAALENTPAPFGNKTCGIAWYPLGDFGHDNHFVYVKKGTHLFLPPIMRESDDSLVPLLSLCPDLPIPECALHTQPIYAVNKDSPYVLD